MLVKVAQLASCEEKTDIACHKFLGFEYRRRSTLVPYKLTREARSDWNLAFSAASTSRWRLYCTTWVPSTGRKHKDGSRQTPAGLSHGRSAIMSHVSMLWPTVAHQQHEHMIHLYNLHCGVFQVLCTVRFTAAHVCGSFRQLAGAMTPSMLFRSAT